MKDFKNLQTVLLESMIRAYTVQPGKILSKKESIISIATISQLQSEIASRKKTEIGIIQTNSLAH